MSVPYEYWRRCKAHLRLTLQGKFTSRTRSPSPFLFWWGIAAVRSMSQFSIPFPTMARERVFEQLMVDHEREVFGFLWRMTGNEQAAYDLSQETFLRLWRHFDKVATYAQPRIWLFRVATHIAMNYRRDQCVRPQLLELREAAYLHATASDPTGVVAEREAIEHALLLLPKRLRAALILRDVYGCSSDQIAHALNVSRAAAKMAVFRARERFRTQYLREEDER